MITSKIKYLGNLRTTAVHLQSNNEIITDAPIDNEGQGQAFSPTDLTATSLASCMLTIIGIKAKKHNINLSEIDANITKKMSSNPRKISEVIVEFNFKNKNYSEKEKKIIERSARNCPVALSLHPEIKQNLIFNF